MGRGLYGAERLADRKPRRELTISTPSTPPTQKPLYQLLERDVVPTFYDRDQQGVPKRWCAIVRQAIMSVTPRFSARRMVKEYAENMYSPAMRQHTDQGAPTR